MIATSHRLDGVMYRKLIPQTPEDEKVIAEMAEMFPAEINGSKISTISGDGIYRVTDSLTHDSESGQLHLCWRA